MSWKSKSSWYIATKDRSVQPELQRSVVKHIGATVFETGSSLIPILFQPDLVLDVIRKAANAAQQLRRHKVHRSCFSEPDGSLGHPKGEATLQTSAEFVRTYSAIVNALTATAINAEAGLNWLSAKPPDLEEVRRALNTITNDATRAGEIVVRLQAPAKRSSTADDAFDS
jgi:hypothetical protein